MSDVIGHEATDGPIRDDLSYKSANLTRIVRDMADFLKKHCRVTKTSVFIEAKRHLHGKEEAIHFRKSELKKILQTTFQVADGALYKKEIDYYIYNKLVSMVVDVYREIELDFDEGAYYKRLVTSFILQHLNIKSEPQGWFSRKYSGHYVLVSCDLSGKMTVANFKINPLSRAEFLPEYETHRLLTDGRVRSVHGIIYQDEAEIFAIGNVVGSGKVRITTLRPYNDDFMGLRLGKSLLQEAPGCFPVYCRRVDSPLDMDKTGVTDENGIVSRLREHGDSNPDHVIEKLHQIVRLNEAPESDWARSSNEADLPNRPKRPPWSFGIKLNLPE